MSWKVCKSPNSRAVLLTRVYPWQRGCATGGAVRLDVSFFSASRAAEPKATAVFGAERIDLPDSGYEVWFLIVFELGKLYVRGHVMRCTFMLCLFLIGVGC